jgi:hypothetical protein
MRFGEGLPFGPDGDTGADTSSIYTGTDDATEATLPPVVPEE